MQNIYNEIKKEIESNKTMVLTTMLSEKENKTFFDITKKIYREDDLKNPENSPLLKILEAGMPNLIEKETTRESKTYVLVEPFYPKERLIILGGGHIALPLVEIAAKVGFDVTVVDDRPSFANVYRFKEAKQVICDSFLTCFEKLLITRNDYLVIITRGHRHDMDCLRQILKKPETIYVGMIGSKKRVQVVMQELRNEGFDNERMKRVCTPIGLSIGAATPEEISISILAQIIKRKRVDRAETFMSNRSEMDSYMLNELASLRKEPCCMVTIIATKGSTPRGVGSKMLVYKSGQITGSIGGGCSESAIMRTALELIGSRTWKIEEIVMTAEQAEEEGMVCGGVMRVLLEDMPVAKERETWT